jgi:hypothetical protein
LRFSDRQVNYLGTPPEWYAFGRRIIGAIRLDGATYRELSRDPAALASAIAVILLSSLASAFVFLVHGDAPSLSVDVDWGGYPVTRQSNVAAALAGAVLDGGWGLLIWAAQAAVVWFLWNRWLGKRRPRTWRAIAAPLGFANAPLIVFALLELVPVIGSALGGIGLIWTIVTSLVAIRESLTIGWARALLLLVLSVVVLLPLPLMLSWAT